MYMVTIFISNGTLSCRTRFVNFAFTNYILAKKILFMLSHTWVKYENMLSCFVCKYFVFFDSTIDIKKNSEDIRPNAPVFSFPV